MKIDKLAKEYGTYKLEVSFGELIAIQTALESDHSGPVADEMKSAIDWYIQHLPAPGEEKDDVDGAKPAKVDDKPGEFEPPKKDEPEMPGEGSTGMDLGDMAGLDKSLPEPPAE